MAHWTNRSPGIGDQRRLAELASDARADAETLDRRRDALDRIHGSIPNAIRGGAALALTTTLERAMTDADTFHSAVARVRRAVDEYAEAVEGIASRSARHERRWSEAVATLSVAYSDVPGTATDPDELERRERARREAVEERDDAERRLDRLAAERREADEALIRVVVDRTSRITPLDLDRLTAEDRGFPYDSSYDYLYSHPVATVNEYSAEEVMAIFKDHPGDIFPFDIEGATRLEDGDTIRLVGAIPGPDGSGTVRVSTTPTSVTFTVVSDDYFDGPGSTITFRTVEKDGIVLLQQSAVARDANDGVAGAVPLGAVPIFAWNQQAENLRRHLPDPGGDR